MKLKFSIRQVLLSSLRIVISHSRPVPAAVCPVHRRLAGFVIRVATKGIVIAAISLCALSARAATSNGNDFALSFVEAKTPAAKKAVFDGAQGRPHFFRYLQIMEMQDVTEDGRAGVRVTAFEPASYLDVKFTVTGPESLSILRDAPVTKVGDAIAVTGRLTAIEPVKNSIVLESPIVRNKDRLSPKIGKELLSEVNPGATFYSYTEGPRPIMVEARDRDLLQFRDKVMAEGGPKGWFEFLEKELAKRKQQRAAAKEEIKR